MEEFRLLHTVLYVKNWYKNRRYSKYFVDNGKRGIWYDLAKTLNADGYYIDEENPSKYDIVNILTMNQQRLPTKPEILRDFISGIDSENTFKHGYYHKDSFYNKQNDNNDYDMYEAIASYFLSAWRNMTVSELPLLPKPDFINVLPRKNGVTDKSITERWDEEK